MKKLILAFAVCLLLASSTMATTYCKLWKENRGWANTNWACPDNFTGETVHYFWDLAFALNWPPPVIYETVEVFGFEFCFAHFSPNAEYVTEETGLNVFPTCSRFFRGKLFTHNFFGQAQLTDTVYREGCEPEVCGPPGSSPIIVPLTPSGLAANALTDAASGVDYDLADSRAKQRWAWTKADATAGWLVMDDAQDGNIQNGSQMFGDVSPQDEPLSFNEAPNGFRALRVHDRNRDGVLDASDGIWHLLKIWTDTNHNGVSDAGELHELADVGFVSFSLDYKEQRRQDQYGNTFRFRAPIQMADNTVRQAYDVYLLKQ